MPLYDYRCGCGHTFEKFMKIANLPDPVHCECGEVAIRQLSFAAVQVMQGYESPITGKWIDTPRQRRDDLERSGSRPWEGIEQETKVVQQREKDFDKMLDKSAEKAAVEAWHKLPQETKREFEKAA